MADSYVGFRMPLEMRRAAEALAHEHGMTLSEWLRMIIDNALSGNVQSVDEGYKQARATAMQIAKYMLDSAYASLPDSYDEATRLLHG